MNRNAQQHLDKAAGYVAKGEEFYRKAADEIIAAQKADPTLSNREIGERFGKGREWVRQIVTWRTTGRSSITPYGGRELADLKDKEKTKKVLRDEASVDDLLADPEIRNKVGRALDRHYEKETTRKRQAQHDREVQRVGGPDEHEAYLRRQRIAEVVNVARGLTTGMRFVVEEVKRLDLDEFEEAGSITELIACADEVDGFAVLLHQFLAGDEITDEAIENWIGGTK